ncbi:hypothetical protein [Mangrovactinospora gilvigrisea]|uniref:hypothetical protein n=1 Tax=Mangrovactinospora gilvigrisea TaxID=1428644 RepID=UPI000AB46C11|nr:hypothetical protein [Mangrovactinospora gilvigrisea]
MRAYAERTVCAPSVEILEDGVSYVRGWGHADRATKMLAVQLDAAGLAADFAGLKADVSVHGDGMVRLGMVSADAADRLVELLVGARVTR